MQFLLGFILLSVSLLSINANTQPKDKPNSCHRDAQSKIICENEADLVPFVANEFINKESPFHKKKEAELKAALCRDFPSSKGC